MGADLYIQSTFKPNQKRYSLKFNEWVAVRDALKQAGNTEQADRAQKKVTKYYDKMYAKGYFRDSYNTTNLLWQFGVSWWMDVGKLLDRKRKLSPENAQKLLDMLRKREGEFKSSLTRVTREEETYFVEKYEEFKAFLREAIRKNESVACSI